MKPDSNILTQFNITGTPVSMGGLEKTTFKVGKIVLKKLYKDTIEYSDLISDCYSKIKEDEFRVPKPLKTINGKWFTDDNWSAWTFLEGDHDYKPHIQESILSIISYHVALKGMPKPEFLETVNSPYIRADKFAWGEMLAIIHPDVKNVVENLYQLVKPVHLEDQLIHGDLNPDNLLFSESLPTGIIDIAPYWRPVEFALGVYAYWVGPWRDDPEALSYFEEINEIDQMLIRAGIRMLLVMSEFNKINDIEKYKRATEIILDRFS